MIVISYMPRVQSKNISDSEEKDLLEEFWTIIAMLETKEEVRNLFRDLLSKTEALMLARRIRIAKLLVLGKSYPEIQKALRTAPNTIAGVQRWMQSGFGGYEASISNLEKELAKLKKSKNGTVRPPAPFSYTSLKKKYPLHFLLFNIFDELAERKDKKK